MPAFDDLLTEINTRNRKQLITEKYNSKKTIGKELIEIVVYKLKEHAVRDWIESIKRCGSIEYFDHHPYYLNSEWIAVDKTLRLGEDIDVEEIETFIKKDAYSISVTAITQGALYEIDNIGVDEVMWPDGYDELMEGLIEYAEDAMKPTGLSHTMDNPVSIITVWEYWSDKHWTDCGWEYDGGLNYCGILDKNRLYVLEKLKKDKNDDDISQ